jgi:hypothetical protein
MKDFVILMMSATMIYQHVVLMRAVKKSEALMEALDRWHLWAKDVLKMAEKEQRIVNES